MSFTVSGSTWTAQSATTHANSMLATLNTTLSAYGITLKATTSNIVWLVLLAVGSIRAAFDTALTAAKNSFDLSLCDDTQLLNLLPIAGTSRIAASYSTLTIAVTAGTAAATIPAGTEVICTNQTVYFATDAAVTIPASTTVSIATTAESTGAITVLVGEATGFVQSIANVSTVTNTVTSIPGHAQESYAELRSRLQLGNTVSNNVDGLITALRSLPGIDYANAFFNVDTVTTLTLAGGVTVSPRHIRMIVHGTSDKIADTFAARMLVPTEGAYTQTYTTKAGQALAILYDVASTTNIYVTIYVDSAKTLSTGYVSVLYATLVALNSTVTVGQAITQEYINNALADVTACTVLGSMVSLDGTTWARKVSTPANTIPVFTGNTTYVIVTLET